MSKFKEFLNKTAADDAAKKEILTILGDKKLVEASDEQLAKVSEVAKKFGVDITAEEIKEFASGGVELDDEELNAVAGGFDSEGRPENAADWYVVAKEYRGGFLGSGYGNNDGRGDDAAEAIAAKHKVSCEDVKKSYEFFVAMGIFPF